MWSQAAHTSGAAPHAAGASPRFISLEQHSDDRSSSRGSWGADSAPRTPFKPVRNFRPGDTPPASPALSSGFSPRPPSESQMVSQQQARATPLGTSSAHNLQTDYLAAGPAKSTRSKAPPVSTGAVAAMAAAINSGTPPPNELPLPRIRAKVTPGATKARKVPLAGAQNAEMPPPPPPTIHASTLASPSKRAASSARPALTSHSAFASQAREPSNPFHATVDSLANDLSGLGLSVPRISRTPSMRSTGKGKDNVLVCVRSRPAAKKLVGMQSGQGDEEAWVADSENARVYLKDPSKLGANTDFTFDSVVSGTDNAEVYGEAGQDLVMAAMEGFDAVVFAYGQTASGKTFTLSGNAANPGITPRAVAEIFSYIRDHPEREFLLRVSYLEIYNEQLKDLLNPDSDPPRIRQDENKKFFVAPLREEIVTGEAQVEALLARGNENRKTGRTDFNERSSRSHSVFQLTIESKDDLSSMTEPNSPAVPLRPKTPNGPRLTPGASGAVRMSRLSLIDLAGSEQATSQSERRSEGSFINKSLLTLEKVIASLTEDGKKKPHVPYRDSKLTQILQPSLSGDARVSVIATMNPSPFAIEETKSTLKFATRVKKVTLKAVVNEIVDEKALIHQYQIAIQNLEHELATARAAQNGPPTTPRSQQSSADRERREKEKDKKIEDLKTEIANLKTLFLNSGNVDARRASMLPPRPVSPIKMKRVTEEDEDGTMSTEDKLADALDTVARITEETRKKDAEHARLLKDFHRVEGRNAELEERYFEARVPQESEKEEKISELVKECQQLKIIVQNQDDDIKQNSRLRMDLDQAQMYISSLEDQLKQERKHNSMFEKYIIQHFTSQADLLSQNRRESHLAPFPSLPSSAGIQSLQNEQPDLLMYGSSKFVDLDDLHFSNEGRQTISIARSNSRLFG